MRKEFIEAFQWYFGCTKKEAQRQYTLRRKENPESIRLIIDGYKLHCKKVGTED